MFKGFGLRPSGKIICGDDDVSVSLSRSWKGSYYVYVLMVEGLGRDNGVKIVIFLYWSASLAIVARVIILFDVLAHSFSDVS